MATGSLQQFFIIIIQSHCCMLRTSASLLVYKAVAEHAVGAAILDRSLLHTHESAHLLHLLAVVLQELRRRWPCTASGVVLAAAVRKRA